MPHLLRIEVELDTEYESEAQRMRHVLSEVLSDEEGVTGVVVYPPQFLTKSVFDAAD